MVRKTLLTTGEYYHVLTRSIDGTIVFRKPHEYRRMVRMIPYYQVHRQPISFSSFIRTGVVSKSGFFEALSSSQRTKDALVSVVAYCLMPTHLHFVLGQREEKGISVFMSNLLNSYTRYFNLKNKRKGPLWEGRFKSIWVGKDEQMAHLIRYVHLNPATAGIVENPKDWMFSSYREYLGMIESRERLCDYRKIFDIDYKEHESFCMDRLSYQKELAVIKNQILE